MFRSFTGSAIPQTRNREGHYDERSRCRRAWHVLTQVRPHLEKGYGREIDG
jgi:hypothetical protein